MASRNGRAKRRSTLGTFPWVRSISCVVRVVILFSFFVRQDVTCEGPDRQTVFTIHLIRPIVAELCGPSDEEADSFLAGAKLRFLSRTVKRLRDVCAVFFAEVGRLSGSRPCRCAARGGCAGRSCRPDAKTCRRIRKTCRPDRRSCRPAVLRAGASGRCGRRCPDSCHFVSFPVVASCLPD